MSKEYVTISSHWAVTHQRARPPTNNYIHLIKSQIITLSEKKSGVK